MELELINFRVKAAVKTEKIEIPQITGGRPGLESARLGERECVFAEEPVSATIYRGEKLQPGDQFSGPAIIEERITTVVVPPGFDCAVDSYGNYVLSRA